VFLAFLRGVVVRESGIPLINEVFFIGFILIKLGIVTKCRMRYFYLSLRWKQMESYGFFTMNRERLIGRIYGRVLRVSLMFCYDGIKDALD
jgi:hypothetical protein